VLTIIWLIIETMVWYRLAVMFPTHRHLIGWLMLVIIAVQLFRGALKVMIALGEAKQAAEHRRQWQDEQEEARRAPDDNRPLRRYTNLSIKRPSEMNAQELREYFTQLHQDLPPEEEHDVDQA
jgi:hypothetical protein